MPGNILIMAAGTGGHVFPALACAQVFTQRGYQVHWLGAGRGIENELVPTAGYTLHTLNISGVRGKGVGSLLAAPFKMLGSLLQAQRLMRELKPVCVLGFGGYVTGPGGLAAKIASIPLVIHEQNAVAGTANRILAKFATRICEAFPNTFTQRKNCITTGNPVREELFNTATVDGLTDRTTRLFVVGGSLGAEPLNKLVPAALAKIEPQLRPAVLHQAGRDHDEVTRERYLQAGVAAQVVPFMRDMAGAYAEADLVICRAGALTISELAATGRGSFLVPLPHAIDDHQTRNAEFLAKQGAAILLPQHTTNADDLAAQLTEVLMDKNRIKAMGEQARLLAQPEATQDVVSLCLEVARG
ncbi:undecaprenyldiphospho-muramoylpentapeptide beta-N-acetylglucosaminyltransferase [Denitrificimonas sp. JX-1]|uniref:UDP-N-acetylglucosamine--N-acetylmuramyl-(pentapeptide) pyrophosphoryl-undecaprenol N-acetylglucosamine transferase n=1 Tax=Denitrificimonas halotolerans TaxID=3098930 RepID=A0ABU5GTX6_9GAMM|nr:undecaprenyldiphospho-muramoylpentapeptide beta-N-acetylglucosaminyltransferase [Denitrificimonas sp. JX-1]MDY7220249.1 undecaprenyldiphospho-muramoylpentapeptide beta-N-acetylglucosaminyltransferase [Denitrificimonas sp. JX-1]